MNQVEQDKKGPLQKPMWVKPKNSCSAPKDDQLIPHGIRKGEKRGELLSHQKPGENGSSSYLSSQLPPSSEPHRFPSTPIQVSPFEHQGGQQKPKSSNSGGKQEFSFNFINIFMPSD